MLPILKEWAVSEEIAVFPLSDADDLGKLERGSARALRASNVHRMGHRIHGVGQEHFATKLDEPQSGGSVEIKLPVQRRTLSPMATHGLLGSVFLLQQPEQLREISQRISLCPIGVDRVARIRAQLEDRSFIILKS
jgi:hypothetical protein